LLRQLVGFGSRAIEYFDRIGRSDRPGFGDLILGLGQQLRRLRRDIMRLIILVFVERARQVGKHAIQRLRYQR
jgi:hypothetical protein